MGVLYFWEFADRILYEYFTSPMSAAYPAHLILLYFIIPVIQPAGKSKNHKFLIMQFSLDSCFFLSIRSKYSPQYLIFKQPNYDLISG
jgi:hypothetical protein